MKQVVTIGVSVAAGAVLTLLIPSLHAQTAAAPSHLIMQAAAQTSATVMPVTFVLDLQTRRVKACRAPTFSPDAGPVCSSWTNLGS